MAMWMAMIISGWILSHFPTSCLQVPSDIPCLPCRCTQYQVDCSGLDLTTIPGNLPATVRFFNLSNNHFRSLQARSFVQFTEVLTLDLSHNKLQLLDKDVFVGLNQLKWLSLAWNNLSPSDHTYPADVFFPLRTSLNHLELNGNSAGIQSLDLKYPDSSLSSLVNLQFLALDGLANTIFGPGFSHMTSLTRLNLTGHQDGFCNMMSLSNRTFMHMPSSLRLLNMSDCNISSIEADTFRPLKRLEMLDLSYNIYLGFKTLGLAFYGLQGSNLIELYANTIVHPYDKCVSINASDIRYLRNTSLQYIDIQNNRLELVNENIYQSIPVSLRYLLTSMNKLGFGNYFRMFGNLTNLEVVYNDGQPHARVISNHDHSLNLRQWKHYHDDMVGSEGLLEEVEVNEPRLDWDWASPVKYFDTIIPPSLSTNGPLMYVLPPKLTTYVSRYNQLYYVLNKIHFDPNNALKTLDLRSNLLVSWEGPVVGLNQLTELDLSDNLCYSISQHFFQNLTSLELFNGSVNTLRSSYKNDTEGDIFAPLSNLKTLDLTRTEMNEFHYPIFRGLVSLKTLNLSYNYLPSFDVNITHMKNLTTIVLAYNNIKTLPQSVMDHLDSIAMRNVTVTVDLSFNAIACTCEHIDFLNWIQNSQVRFVNGDKYSCQFADGTIMKMTNIFFQVSRLQKTCNDSTAIIVGASICLICLVTALVVAVVYRFRWKLRYLYYASRLAYTRLHHEDSYEFDAFVSHSSKDSTFVYGTLTQRLENEASLRLIIPERDFKAGQMLSHIVRAVQSSRHTLVVLTRNLLESERFLYEMQMAVMESVHTGRDVLIFLLYDDISGQKLSQEVLYNLQASTYIQFPSNPSDELENRKFWKRLTLALKH